MNKAVINVNADLKPFLGSTVGYMKVNEPWVHHNNSYECAAWWEDSTIEKGVYALTLEKNSFAPHDLYLLGKLDAVVTDDYFPALWGGVRISNKPYQHQNVGCKRTIRHHINLVEAIEKTGNSPGNSIDICVNPFIIEAVVNAARDSLNNYQDLLTKYWSEYHIHGDGKYRASLSMVAHCAGNMEALGRAIEVMLRHYNYFTEASNFMRDNYVKNTAWAVSA